MASGRVVAGGVISGFVTGAALVLGLFVRERWSPPTIEPPAVRAVNAAQGGAHLAIPGRTVTLKAILTPLPGRLLRYTWEFGDGQVSTQAPVIDPYAVEARHAYAACAPGARYEARLRVLDTTTGLEGVATYPVLFVTPDVETLSAVMLDDALWALHRSMRRTDDPLHGKLGHWSAPRSESGRHDYRGGGTALATLAFVVNGFDLRPERADHPYTETVERGLDFLAATLTEEKLAKEPITDHGANGRGLTTDSPRPGYEVPMTAMAFIGAQAPDRRCGGANPLTSGRTSREVLGDLLDTIHAHQRVQGPAAGGWRYTGGGRDADLSVTQFAALALHAAETVSNLPTPPRVKTALEGYLAKVMGKKGGFGYQPGRGETVSMTGAGLIALTCVGVPSTDPRAARARDFIGADWARENVGDGYAMYTVMKAAKLATSEVTRFGDHDWRREYVLHLARTQRADGAWKDDARWGHGTLATVWPALTLSKDVFRSAAPLESSSITWQAVIGGAAAGVVGAGLLAGMSLRRRPLE